MLHIKRKVNFKADKNLNARNNENYLTKSYSLLNVSYFGIEVFQMDVKKEKWGTKTMTVIQNTFNLYNEAITVDSRSLFTRLSAVV